MRGRAIARLLAWHGPLAMPMLTQESNGLSKSENGSAWIDIKMHKGISGIRVLSCRNPCASAVQALQCRCRPPIFGFSLWFSAPP